MDPNQQKEQFSIAYVHAVATVAGYTMNQPYVDDDSVDRALSAGGGGGTARRLRVDLQMKCTERNVLSEDSLRFPLRLKNYNDLRVEDVLVPRILVVVIVPPAVEDWLEPSEQELLLRHCAYWVSLRGMPAADNTASVTVTKPRSQVFSPGALIAMMQRVNDGGLP